MKGGNKKEMKKLLISFIVLGMLITGVIGVLAVGVPQGTDVTVTADLTLTPTPDPLDFGPLIPLAFNTLPVTLTPGTSNLVVTVSVADVLGTLFQDNLLIDLKAGSGFEDPTTVSIDILAGTPLDVDYQLTVPIATPAGPYDGTITYSVLEKI